jgi:ribose transport system permease protein
MAAVAAATAARRHFEPRRLLRRHGWTIGVYVLLVGMIAYWQSVPARFGSFDWQSLVISASPLAFVAMGQAVVVISGGIDLSVGSMMSVINVISARYMVHLSFGQALLVALGLVLGGALAGSVTGTIITVSRVPDIVVTLAMLFFYAGVALWILEIPGGGAPEHFVRLGTGYTLSPWIPTGLVIIVGVVVLGWAPLRWTKPGLALYSIGSNRSAAYLSGLNVGLTRIGAYALGGSLAAMAGLMLTATAANGSPHAGDQYTLNSVAAIVLGGVSLLGGKGGLIGPVAAAFILTLMQTILVLHGVDQNYAQVIFGTTIVVVVLLGGLILRKSRM